MILMGFERFGSVTKNNKETRTPLLRLPGGGKLAALLNSLPSSPPGREQTAPNSLPPSELALRVWGRCGGGAHVNMLTC